MNFSQKDIVLIPFPFSDLTSSKVRPVLILSNNKFNSIGNDLIVIPLTSVLKKIEYSFEITQNDSSYGKLIKTSRLRLDKITTLEKKLIKLKIGTLNDLVFNKIKLKLNELF
ncbi:MAG: type II toxin-antitoxin system PemK/MazF family toxin [Nanoarchaeales archaeon]|nr:type II toxin-antitoxin system PemK/MazF family toxin [Nanoarchaeales archaeon]